MKFSKPAKYTYEEIRERIEYMSGKKLLFSEQYGMLFILTEDNQIIFQVNGLLKEREHCSACGAESKQL